jgi:RNA polymerase-interacting CarD/CdnL/TRCF family regulator
MAENEKLDLILSKLGQMDERLDRMDERFDKLENDVTGIKLTLENEIRQNIMHVAEVNLDLLRKLDDSQEIDSEKRMLTIHVSILETELRKVKDRLEQIA